MLEIWLRYDLRSPSFGASTADLCAAAIDQVAWADRNGFHTVQLPEHHGSADNYNPSPFVLGAAMASRTKTLRLHPSAVLLPLHDPVRIAEDACVLDNISGGRLDLTIGLGYVPEEFEMFGVALSDRGRLADLKLDVLYKAFAGDTFEYEGRKIHVTPPPIQKPGPRLFIGGSVLATARRAARLGDGYYPMEHKPEFVAEYEKACAELGKAPGRVINSTGPRFIHVAEDPDAAWAKIAPHAMHESNAYASSAEKTAQISPFLHADDAAALRAQNTYLVLTPDECLSLARGQRDKGRHLTLAPMIAGLSPDLAWESLELFRAKVVSALMADAVPPTADTQRAASSP